MNTLIASLLAALTLTHPARAEESDMPTKKTEKATLAAGCFWCVEAVFERIPGVISATSGYIGGRVANPTYQQVCQGDTGHAEAVEIEFDPARVSFERILDVFWRAHDPTQLNRQGNDIGTQYRSAIFFHDEQQKKTAEESMRRLSESQGFSRPIATTLEPAATFYPAEEDHQGYFDNNRAQPYCQAVIQPKLKKLGLEK